MVDNITVLLLHTQVCSCGWLVRNSTVTMILMVAVLGMILVTVSCTPTKPLSTMPLPSRRDDVNKFCYFGGHQPTEKNYRQGVAQYCDGISSINTEATISTITLRDSSDCPIRWIYKMWLEDDAGIGSVSISQDTCASNFHYFVNDSTCPSGFVKFMEGGKYWIEFGGQKPGTKPSKLWIETRQREFDDYPSRCKN
jgi:hypothetical protein